MSLLKEIDIASGRGISREVHYGRALDDGMPYRGEPLPLRDEEYDELTEVVCDSDVRTFDTSDEEQRKTLASIVERSANQWVTIHRMIEKMVDQPDGSVKVFVYCVWSTPFKQPNTQRLQAYGPVLS